MSDIGSVTRVQIDDDIGDVLVDVNISPTREYEEITFRTLMPGMWVVPSVGDVVEVSEFGDKGHVAHSPVNTPDNLMPSGLTQGDFVMRLDSGTEIRITENAGNYDMTINASGNIHIGSESAAKSLLTEDAVFEYTDADGNTKETTTVVNGEITQGEME